MYILLTTTLEVCHGDSTTRYVFEHYCLSPLLGLKLDGTTDSCRDTGRWRVVNPSSNTKSIADVHRLVSAAQTTTANWVAIIISICGAHLPEYTYGTAWIICLQFPTHTTQHRLIRDHDHCLKKTNWPNMKFSIASHFKYRREPKYETRPYSTKWNGPR